MAQLMPALIFEAFDANGAPLVGGKLYAFEAGTSTPLATFTDQGEGTPNPHPIILDANGQCVVWINADSYKLVLKDASDVLVYTRDNVQTTPDGSITTIKLGDRSVTRIKIALGAVGRNEIQDDEVITSKIPNDSITAPKIPDGELPIAKLQSSMEIAFADVAGPRDGAPSSFPKVPWTAPTQVAVPASPAVGDGNCVAWSPSGKLLAVMENNTDFIALFQRFGTELVRLSPGIFPAPTTATGTAVAWSPDAEYFVAVGAVGPVPWNTIYQKYGKSFGNVLFPSNTIAGLINAVAWCPNGNYFALAHDASPYVTVVKRTDLNKPFACADYSSNAGQSIPDSVATIVNFEDLQEDTLGAVVIGAGWLWHCARYNTYTVKVMIDGLTTAFGDIYRNFTIFRRLGGNGADVFGSTSISLDVGEVLNVKATQISGAPETLTADPAKVNIQITENGGYDSLSSFGVLSAPGSLPTGNGHGVAWSPDGKFLAVGHATTPFLTIYERTGDTLAKCADPSALPTGQVNGLSWSPDGLMLTCVHATTPFITSYTRTSTAAVVFTKVPANPNVLPASTGNGCAYNSTGDKLAVAHALTPFITIYSVSGTTFTKDTDPVALPPSTGKSVSWTPDGKYLTVGHVSSPYFATYVSNGAIGTDAVTWVKKVNLV